MCAVQEATVLIVIGMSALVQCSVVENNSDIRLHVFAFYHFKHVTTRLPVGVTLFAFFW